MGTAKRDVTAVRPPRHHSPNTEQPIVRGPRQEVEAVAVGGPGGGEAQGRHSCGVACEFLQCRGETRRQTHPRR